MRLSNRDTVAALKERRTSRRKRQRFRDPNRVPLEHEEQANLIEWAFAQRSTIPELKLLFAIPNQGAARLKNLQTEGVMRGVLDLFLAKPHWYDSDDGRGYCLYFGLFIEIKRRKGGKISPEQYAWIAALSAEGYGAVVCRGADEARTAILKDSGRESC